MEYIKRFMLYIGLVGRKRTQRLLRELKVRWGKEFILNISCEELFIFSAGQAVEKYLFFILNE
jgi:hypothetical protein